MAMRLAFDLGLHVDSDAYVKQGLLSPREKEARQSTFWSCVVVNQYVSHLHITSRLTFQPLELQSGTSVQNRWGGDHGSCAWRWLAVSLWHLDSLH